MPSFNCMQRHSMGIACSPVSKLAMTLGSPFHTAAHCPGTSISEVISCCSSESMILYTNRSLLTYPQTWNITIPACLPFTYAASLLATSLTVSSERTSSSSKQRIKSAIVLPSRVWSPQLEIPIFPFLIRNSFWPLSLTVYWSLTPSLQGVIPVNRLSALITMPSFRYTLTIMDIIFPP